MGGEAGLAPQHLLTAPAAQLALWLHLLTGDADALAFALRCRSFLEATLRRDDRLYADDIDPARVGHRHS